METQPYQIIVRFPSEKIMKEFCGQMSDGFGEGLCDFRPCWNQKPNTDGTKAEHFDPVVSSAPEGTRVFNVTSITEF